MRIIGMSYSTKNGERKYRLEVADSFEPYFKDTGEGRNAIGEKVESIYVGSLDCSQLKVGMEIELIYGRMFDCGININTIREQAGHEDEKTSLNNYCFDQNDDDVKKQFLEASSNKIMVI